VECGSKRPALSGRGPSIRWIEAALIALAVGKPALTYAQETHSASAARSLQQCENETFVRDWSLAPEVELLAHYKGRLYVVGDVHGMPDSLFRLLAAGGLVSGQLARPKWSGGRAILIQVGDVIDKGPDSIAALDLLMELERQAQAVGGRVITIIGNHESAFLADPFGDQTVELRADAVRRKLDLCREVHSAKSKYGRWFRTRPVAVVVNGQFIAHAGWAGGASLEQLRTRYRDAVKSGAWDSPFTCGDHLAHPPKTGILNAKQWWGSDGAPFFAQLSALGVRQVLFGHDALAFGPRGEIAATFGTNDGRALIKLDVGVVYAFSTGRLYRCQSWLPGGGCALHETLVPGRAFEPLSVAPGPPPAVDPPRARLGCSPKTVRGRNARL
jgi:hypothetical protein